jgi:hypothetical protein
MLKLLIHDPVTNVNHWFVLDNHTKDSFHEELKTVFGDAALDREKLSIEDVENIPFEFRHAGVKDKILADRFWDWKNYSDEDKDLLERYIAEITWDDESTLQEAKEYFSKFKNNIDGSYKDI